MKRRVLLYLAVILFHLPSGSVFAADVYALGSVYPDYPDGFAQLPVLQGATRFEGTAVPGYWKNGDWKALSVLDRTRTARAVAMEMLGADLYIGGWCTGTSGARTAGVWKNGNWTALKALDAGKDSEVASLAVSGADLYACGYSTDRSGVAVPGYWKNGAWSVLPPLDVRADARAISVTVAGTDVYVCGNCKKAEDGQTYPGYWKNRVWVGLDEPEGDLVHFIAPSLVVSGKDVLIAGTYLVPIPMVYAGYWKNGEWKQFDNPDRKKAYEFFTNAMIQSGKDIYSAGFYVPVDADSGAPLPGEIPGYWKNGAWNALGSPDPKSGYMVTAVLVR